MRAKIETRHEAIVVPQRAVAELQGSYQVVIVDDKNTAHLKTVQVGEQMGNEWVIEKGLGPHDRVVVEGTRRPRKARWSIRQPYTRSTMAKQ